MVIPKEKSKYRTYNLCPNWVIDSIVLIHFGGNELNRGFFSKTSNPGMFMYKPTGGLWSCPLGSKDNWSKLYVYRGFDERKLNKSFLFKFMINSKILVIDSLSDLLQLPVFEIGEGFYKRIHLNFEELSSEFDAIWLTEKGYSETHLYSTVNFYGWIPDTIYVMNLQSIYQVHENKK